MRIFLTSHVCLTWCSGNCNTSDNWKQSLFSISVPQQPECLAQKRGNHISKLEMLWWHKNIKLSWNKRSCWGNYCSFISHLKIISWYIFSRVPAKGSTQDPVEVSQIFPFIPCLNSPIKPNSDNPDFLLPSWLATHPASCLLFTFYRVNLHEKQQKYFVLGVVLESCVDICNLPDFSPATYSIFTLTIIEIKVSMVII